MNNNKKSKKKIIIISIIVILVLVLIVSKVFKKEAVEEPTFDTAKVETKTLTTTISGTGKVVAENSRNITSVLANYKITKVNVKVGDKVNVGDVICTFDTSDLSKTVKDLQASIDAGTVSGNATVAGAEASLQSAQIQNDMQLDPLNKQVQTAWQEYQNHNTPLQNSKADLAKKQSEAAMLQAQFNASGDTSLVEKINAKNAEVAEAQEIVNQQEIDVKKAKDYYDSLQDQYNKQQQMASASIAGVQSQVASAKAQTSTATLTYEQQLATYRKQLADTNLKATEAGTVTAINVKAGEYYTGGVIATIEGVESFVVETEIDEYDIADVATGMEVILKTDATRDQELSGEVTSVAPAATGSSTASSMTGASAMSSMGATGATSATYTVKIALKTPSDRLRIGMNAKLNIVTQKSENALTVPYDAITEKEDGSKVITIIKDDNSEEEVTVTTGLESGYYTEISSDKIKEGTKVKVPKVDSANNVDELLNSMGATAGM